MFLPVGLAVVVTLALVMVLVVVGGIFVHDFTEARVEDQRWAEACDVLGKGAQEIAALDTRLLRPWGTSTAGQTFAVAAKSVGHDWLLPAAVGVNMLAPLGIRAVAGEIAGTKVAFLVARTRRDGLVARRLALAASGLVVEEALACVAPPVGFVRDLEALARRVAVPA